MTENKALLPPTFTFTQSNLQDFTDCPRRFELRYLLHQAWPALESQPVLEREAHMRAGYQFHQLIQQHQLGLPVVDLNPMAEDSVLGGWWQAYLDFITQTALPAERRAEYTLSMPFAGFRLLAKFDLLAMDAGQSAVILDWKTSQRRPSRRSLKARLQTRLYPFILTAAGAQLNQGQPWQPEQVQMIYWFAEDPTQPETFPYSEQQYRADGQFLEALIERIQQTRPSSFELTTNEKICPYCNYRSLCNRGSSAGSWQEMDDELDVAAPSGFNLDFDQIGEIAF